MVYGRKDCTCGDGTCSSKENCPECKGTGRGKRGGKGGCKKCYGYKYVYNHDVRSVCDCCNGNFKNFFEENNCDDLPNNWIDNVPLVIKRSNAGLSFNESYLDYGLVYSLFDHGKSFNSSDEDIIREVQDRLREEKTQAIKVINKANEMPKCLYVSVKLAGYSVISSWRVQNESE